MDAIPDQDPSRSTFRSTLPFQLVFEDVRLSTAGQSPPPVLFPDDPLSRERLRLLDALDRIATAEYERTLDAQCTVLAGIIFDAYRESKEAGSPPQAQ